MRSSAKIRSKRNYLHIERRFLVWNHGNAAKCDRALRRAQRRVERQLLRVTGG